MCNSTIYKSLLVLIGIYSFLTGFSQPFELLSLDKGSFLSNASVIHDYDGDGDLDIITSRANPDGVYWLENEPTRQFNSQPLFTNDITFYISDLDTADFDNDGDLDYLVSMTNVNDGELAWFQRQADDTYLKWTIATNKDFIMADVADFDGDGWMDIVAVGLINSERNCRVYFNQQNLFFTETTIAENSITEAVDAEDIDGDGDIDIAVAGSGLAGNPGSEDGGARTLLNDGEGNFTLGNWLVSWSNVNTALWETVKIVDLNGDGKKDVLGFRAVALAGLLVFDGANDFNRIDIDDDGNIDIGGDFVVFDLDGNGKLDIVRQARTEDRLSILYQEDDFAFRREYIELNWDNCCNPTAKMSVGDLDEDGDLDVFFPEQGNLDEDISWFENINGMLYRHHIAGDLYAANTPKLGDIDGDGDLDIMLTLGNGIIPENEVNLFENLDGENFINWRIHDNMDNATDIELADIDGDGDLDAFVTARDADDLVWLRNDGFKANWVADTIFPEANSPIGIAAGDIDNDEDIDAVLCSWNDDKIFGFTNNGEGNFSPLVIDANIDEPREAELSDIDKDGDLDLIVAASSEENTVVFYENQGDNNFTKDTLYKGGLAFDLGIGDWNKDGNLDIVVALGENVSSDGVDLVALINKGENSFEVDTLVAQRGITGSVHLEDIDLDGDLDAIFGRGRPQSNLGEYVQVAINQGGEVTEIIVLAESTRGSTVGITSGNLDDDGIPDIVFAGQSEHELIIIKSPQITTSISSKVTTYPMSVYPNPVSDELHVELPDLRNGFVQVRLTNLIGQTLLRNNYDQKEFQVKLGDIPKGLYVLSIISANSELLGIQKIIIE
ncbi:MAG: FG-GAP-like repeat-containing protein [Bacteroidota bacterium]